MLIQIEQNCPQCGAPVTLSENDRLLTCPYCGVKNFLVSDSSFRYVLPARLEPPEDGGFFYSPYVRFKGTVFTVAESGIAHHVVDTTQAAGPMPGLPPSLGVRPQAMKVGRLTQETEGRFLRPTIKAPVILEKAARLSQLAQKTTGTLFHRAYIGETLSFIYLPLLRDQEMLVDAVLDSPLVELEKLTSYPLKGSLFNPRWQVGFLATLCPRCGWNLDGEGDCLVMTCSNCDTAWAPDEHGLQQVDWQMVPGGGDTACYLGFWKISAHITALNLYSFADFIRRTNQALLPRKEWHERVMSFWIPAFKLQPKIFLQAGRQTTIGQWRLQPEEGHVVPNMYPVTLPLTEARQAIKLILAASATTHKNIFPFLPQMQLSDVTAKLVLLPFVDKGHDWVQPETGTAIAKQILHYSRSL